jgi:uncharacterized protein (TIGR04222 family)
MNPFNLTGPQFLLFYSLTGVTILFMLRHWRRHQEAGYAAPSRLDDPYLFAMLRGGEQEAVRVALMSLMDRKLVVVQGEDQLARAPGVSASSVERDIEKAIILYLDQPHLALSVISGVSRDRALADYGHTLQRMNLLPTAEQNGARLKLLLIGLAVLLGLGAAKVAVGMARHRPVIFLVLLIIALGIAACVVCFPRRTVGGDQMVRNMKELFAGLRDRAASLHAGGATSELAWLGAVFGMAAVPSLIFPFQQVLLPKQRVDQTAGSACGGGCGGGCGGCGG